MTYADLTPRDRQLARRYLALRAARKVIEHDRKAFDDLPYDTLKLARMYTALIDAALPAINEEIERLRREFIRVQATETDGVYAVKVGNRAGHIEVNGVELTRDVSEIIRKFAQ